MYYEIHGSGEPLVLLHGSLTTMDASFGKVLPTLAETRQVIAIEQQAHGHTMNRADWLLPMIGEFLDAPMPEVE